MKSKQAAARMRSYAIEIKGIARSEVPNNKLPGKKWVRKLQAREPGSILRNPCWGPQMGALMPPKSLTPAIAHNLLLPE
jgi:hypothetical protein